MAKAPKKSAAVKAAPILENGKVRLGRLNRKGVTATISIGPVLCHPPSPNENLDRRTREYLTPAEVEKLLQASIKVGLLSISGRSRFISLV